MKTRTTTHVHATIFIVYVLLVGIYTVECLAKRSVSLRPSWTTEYYVEQVYSDSFFISWYLVYIGCGLLVFWLTASKLNKLRISAICTGQEKIGYPWFLFACAVVPVVVLYVYSVYMKLYICIFIQIG